MSDDCTKLLRRMTQVMWRVFCAGEPVILCVSESIFDYRISDHSHSQLLLLHSIIC